MAIQSVRCFYSPEVNCLQYYAAKSLPKIAHKFYAAQPSPDITIKVYDSQSLRYMKMEL